MLTIDVLPPVKTESAYEFTCALRGHRLRPRELARRAGRLLGRGSAPTPSRVRFGFRAVGFPIHHHELWDAVYPLMFLTRNGGPLFGTGRDRATIRLPYPIARAVRDFYVRRAANFGLDVTVEADTVEPMYVLPTAGHVLAFGGGKDSRLLLGVLRELGVEPRIVSTWAENVTDLAEAHVTEPVSGVLADRVMPALMAGGRHFYFGSGLGEVHLQTPWQQYYDWGSPAALAEFSRFLASLGVRMHAHAPAATLPYNLIQRILFERYPELYAHQRSVAPDEPSDKNLHVSLCELRHGIPFHRHCSEGLFRELVARFVRTQTTRPADFGYRNHRAVICREMRAIVFRMRDHALLAHVRHAVPDEWEGAWIDYLHTYVAPDTPPEVLRIYRRYARPVDAAPPGAPIWRVPV